MVCSDLGDRDVVCVVGRERVEKGNLLIRAIAGVGMGGKLRGGGGEVPSPGEVCRQAVSGGGILQEQWGVEGVRAVGKGG